MFESLSDKIQGALSKLTGKGKLNEQDIDTAMREVRLALLEADVNFKVTRNFIKVVKERCLGQEVMESLTPGQMVVKIVNQELTQMMGEEESKLNIEGKRPSIILLCGLQGAGKTTHAGKLANIIKKRHRTPLLVACDIYRPAAIQQLQIVGKQVDVPVFSMGTQVNPVDIAKAGVEEAKRTGRDLVIVDTAGRLHIDENLMGELKNIKDAIKPDEILLVVDAMTGQDAVNVSETFNESLDITGVVLTKLDGDARGGAALSIRSVTQKPIKFIGVGEKLEDLQVFHPDRMASRILGMGDVLSLIEKAEDALDEKKARALQEKLRNQSFTFNDFLDQLQQVRNIGPLEDLLSMMPGMNSKALKGISIDEKEIQRVEAMIQAMTPEEREKPDIINTSRKERIAKGSGTTIVELNKLLKQFKDMKKMMKQFSSFGKKAKKKGKFKFPFFR
ncbi:signal recognition particle protein [Peptostreptococcaceae bacterium oral taxon 113 str. W5053]|nr:signal recognition particle protein [Peptostreptococcaceae bacterium oral taxon 113 str. W5053]